MYRLSKHVTVVLGFVVVLNLPVRAQDEAPWLRYGAGNDPTVRLQKQVGTRAANALCHSNVVETRSPVDRIALSPQARAELTPALAQVAGLVAMVADEQRPEVEALAIKELRDKNAWTPAAEQGYFKYLLVKFEEIKGKANAAMGVAGAVAGGLTGALSSGILNDLGAYTIAGQALNQGQEQGSERARQLRPTAFTIHATEAAVTTVLDALIAEPCRISATDAIIALREKN